MRCARSELDREGVESIRDTTLRRAADLARGGQLVSHGQVQFSEEVAPGIPGLFGEIRATLEVAPAEELLFQMLAAYPDVVLDAWKQSSGLFGDPGFAAAAARLRRGAFLAFASGEPDEVRDDRTFSRWTMTDEGRAIVALTERSRHLLPKLLLVATVFDELLAGRRVVRFADDAGVLPGADDADDLLADTEPVPLARCIEVPSPAPASGGTRLRKLLARIEEDHGHPGIAGYYRALGRWPEFLEEAGAQLRPFVRSVDYVDARDVLVSRALASIETTEDPTLSPGRDPGAATDLRAILALFRFQLIPETLLEVTAIREMMAVTPDVVAAAVDADRGSSRAAGG